MITKIPKFIKDSTKDELHQYMYQFQCKIV